MKKAENLCRIVRNEKGCGAGYCSAPSWIKELNYFEAFCADMGMTMTTAINIFARKAVRENRIPFEISGDVPNAETQEAIREVKQMKADPTLGKTYTDVDEMMKELR